MLLEGDLLATNGGKNDSGGQTSIVGDVSRVIYHNQDGGFGIFTLTGVEFAVRGSFSQPIAIGDSVECVGEFVQDPKYGRQFKASLVVVIPPSTVKGIERYLASGAVKGIGPTLAKRLVEKFGAETVRVIDETPERLLELPGFGPGRLEALRASWAETRAIRDTMIFLRTHGIGPAIAARLHKLYGLETILRITENPYRLVEDVRGIGFTSADRIARSLGLPYDSAHRIRAGVMHVMRTRRLDGHCAATRAVLRASAMELLADPGAGSLPVALVEDGIEACLGAGELVLDPDGPGIYLASIFSAERTVAARIARLCTGMIPWGAVDPKWAIRWAQDRTGLAFSPSQADALLRAVSSKVAIITGGPGTGKTTMLKGVLGVVMASKASVTLCAPTGRAAKRLAESTGMEATTIHRLLRFDPMTEGFVHGFDNPLETDFVVVDEASMVDVSLMASLLAAIPDGAGLLIVGDEDQLPSVGPGMVLADLISSGCVPLVRLTEIYRQAQDSLIVQNAHRINHGRVPDGHPQRASSPGLYASIGWGRDFYYVEAESDEQIADRLYELVSRVLPSKLKVDPLRDIQVLTPMRRNSLGTEALNEGLRKLLNPNKETGVSRFDKRFTVGDKVQQIVNDYQKEVYNGDLGVITAIDLEDQVVFVEFDTGVVKYSFQDLDDLVLAYACTIHKSQGSEYPIVVIPLGKQHYMMQERNLLYTAVTRGKSMVILLGMPSAVKRAVATQTSKSRVTGLVERIKSEVLWS